MVIKRKDFQKAAAFIHEFLLKLNEDVECAEVRDTLNLALLHMQKYYRLIQNRTQEKCTNTLSVTARGLSPMTPFVDAPDKFIWRWVNLDNTRPTASIPLGDSLNLVILPPLINAVKAGAVKLVSELIHKEPTCIDCVDGLGRTGIMYAVHFFQHDTLRFLLDKKSDLNFQAHDGSTALHRACHNSNPVALKLLIDYGGDFTVCDVQGRAPIHWAVTTQSTECLQILLAYRASPCTPDKDGMTPSMWACRMDNIQHFELLCQVENSLVDESDGIEQDANGRTWMHWSVRRTMPLECLQTLLTADSATIKDDEGKTVLLVAAEMGALNACRLILDIAGEGCIRDQDNQGRSALHLATMGGHGDVVNFLLDKNADVNVVDIYNATAWDYACIHKLHYCKLIIMSHQRQRMSRNPTSPLPIGIDLLMREESEVQNDFNRMSFRTRSNISTPITPPHPPKRPRSSHILARRATNLAGFDQDKIRQQERRHQSENRVSVIAVSGTKERIVPLVEAENDVISLGEMDVSDVEDKNQTPHHSATSSKALYQLSQYMYSGQGQLQSKNRPEHLSAPSPPGSGPKKGNNFNIEMKKGLVTVVKNGQQDQFKAQNLQQVPHGRMELETAASGSSWTLNSQPGRPRSLQVRPQARVPPTPIYPPPHGAPVPSPPITTPLRPCMLRQQQPLPSSSIRGPLSLHQEPHEFTSSSLHEGGSPLSSQSSEPLQHSSHSQNERSSAGGNQPLGLVEGRHIPPPALTPLHNAPKPPNLDMLEQLDKKKKKKDKRGMKSPAQKPENPYDIPPPRGFAAPLHPHMQVVGNQGIHSSSAASPAARFSKSFPHMSESRYVDENVDDSGMSPFVNDFASKPVKQVMRGEIGVIRTEETEEGMAFDEEKQSEVEDTGSLIPAPPSFRGGDGRHLVETMPQEHKNSMNSAKPPLPKSRMNMSSARSTTTGHQSKPASKST